MEEDIFSLSETTVENVLEFTEEKNNYCFLSRNATIFEALERFRGHQQEGKRLEAILVTNSGGKTEDLLSIITIWDLPRILKKLQE